LALSGAQLSASYFLLSFASPGFLDYSARREVALTRDPNTLFRQRGVLVAIFADLLTRLPCRLWLVSICAKVPLSSLLSLLIFFFFPPLRR
jgi:hypothetical protein